MSGVGFSIDLGRCTGCAACTLACALEHGSAAGPSHRRVTTVNPARHPGVAVRHVSLSCCHCDDPACLPACPARAYGRDPESGVVTHDAGRCMGCAYCTWVCPYEAPQVIDGIAYKCTLCHERLAAGREPACVAACPTAALRLTPVTTAETTSRVPGLPRSNTRPRLTVIEPDRGLEPPELAPPSSVPLLPGRPLGSSARYLRDWPLLVFSATLTVLVAWFTAGLVGAPPPPPLAFAIAAAAGIGASLLHLGRPFRFWRALTGVATSWVSREALLAGAFTVLATVVLIRGATASPVGWAVAVLGWATLLAVDMVYAVPGVRPALPHSAMATLTGAFLTAVLAGAWPAAVAAAVVKGVLASTGLRPGRPRPERILVGLRIVLGLVLPMTLWAGSASSPHALVVILALVGEIVDRANFYADLRFPSPADAAREALVRLDASTPARR